MCSGHTACCCAHHAVRKRCDGVLLLQQGGHHARNQRVAWGFRGEHGGTGAEVRGMAC